MSLIVRSMLGILVGIALLLTGQTSSEAVQECRWFGTKPFCDGQCPSGWKYSGERRGCTSGSQRKCCREIAKAPLPGPVPQTCRWFGTPPFCNGQCPSGWTYSGKRQSCTTGSKRYCCYHGTVPPPPPPPKVDRPPQPTTQSARYCTNNCDNCRRDGLRCRQRSIVDVNCPSTQSFFLAPHACY